MRHNIMKFQQEWIQTTLDSIDVEGTRKRYHEALNQFWGWYEAEGKPDLTVQLLNRYKRFLQDNGYSPSTITISLSSVKKAITVNFRPMTVIERMDLQDMQKLKSQHVKPDNYSTTLTGEEVTKLFASCNPETHLGIRNLVILVLLFYVGLRRGEIANLSMSDYDKSHDIIFIKRAKGNKNKALPLHPLVIEKLDAWLTIRSSIKTTSNSLLVTVVDDVQGKGRPLTGANIYSIMRSCCKKAKIAHYHPHDGRATFITNLHNKGVGIGDIQELVGHSSPNTTLGYFRTDFSKLREAILKL